jgi:hypothetical protein
MISVDVERSTRIHYCRELIKAGPAHHNRFFFLILSLSFLS